MAKTRRAETVAANRNGHEDTDSGKRQLRKSRAEARDAKRAAQLPPAGDDDDDDETHEHDDHREDIDGDVSEIQGALLSAVDELWDADYVDVVRADGADEADYSAPPE
jgi:hypothetical protein